MALTIREEQSAISNTAAVSFTLASSQIGDTVILVQTNNFYTLANLQTPTGTAVTTWELKDQLDGGSNSFHIKVWKGVVTTAGGTVLVNNSTTDEERYSQIIVVAGPTDYDVSLITSGASSTSHVASSVTPSNSDDILLCSFWAYTGGDINYTMPGGMTPYTERDISGLATGRSSSEQLTSNAATGTRTATASIARVFVASSVLIKASTPSVPEYGAQRSTLIHPGNKPGSNSFRFRSQPFANGAPSVAPEVFGSAALSIESNVGTVSTLTIPAITALSGQSNVGTIATLTIPGVSVLSGQSNVGTIATLTISGVSALSAILTLTSVGGRAINGIAGLTFQSNMNTVPSLTVFATSGLTFQSNMNTVPSLTVFAISGLTFQSSMNTVPSLTVFAQAPLTIQSTLNALAKLTINGVSAQSNVVTMIVVGTIQGTGPSAVLSIQSTMVTVGSLTVKGSAQLSSDSTLGTVAKVDIKAQTALAANLTLAPVAFLTIKGQTVFSDQSSLVASGTTAVSVFGAATLNSQVVLIASGNTSPPWEWRLIEITDTLIGSKESTLDVSNRDSKTNSVAWDEGITLVIEMEAG